jgi:hypothetical protein
VTGRAHDNIEMMDRHFICEPCRAEAFAFIKAGVLDRRGLLLAAMLANLEDED